MRIVLLIIPLSLAACSSPRESQVSKGPETEKPVVAKPMYIPSKLRDGSQNVRMTQRIRARLGIKPKFEVVESRQRIQPLGVRRLERLNATDTSPARKPSS